VFIRGSRGFFLAFEREMVKATLSTTPPAELAVDLLLLPLFGPEMWRAGTVREIDRQLQGRLRREATRFGFRGKEGDEFLFQTHAALPAQHVMIVAAGNPSLPATWYRIADTAAGLARRLRLRDVAVAMTPGSAEQVRAVAEGFLLARYSFTRYRSSNDAPSPAKLVLAVARGDARLQRAIDEAQIGAGATCLARDLVNTPAGELTPTVLAAKARALAGSGLRVRVHQGGALRRLGMGALLGVAQGSAEEPCFIECVFRPRGRVRRSVALVGKGITFDSGGLSLKTAQAMQTQKRDMAGGAVVLAVMSTLPALKPPVEVRGYVPSTENMPGGRAIKPGDVLRAFNGKTIEVLNTDAEGRLVLADALSYAASRNPDLILDFATLTGAVNTALGPRYAAIMGTDRDLVGACIAAGKEVDEKLWELPLAVEYRRDLDSTVADLKNVGEGPAGTIIGGLFLREFAGDVPWAHVDFSSTVMTEGHAAHPKGATGFGVRTLLRFLARL
jgi:leucyl aminopeptidase